MVWTPERREGEPVLVNNKPRYPALMSPSSPTKVEAVHGCRFSTPVYFDRGKLYYIVVNNRPPGWKPDPGFYDVPEKGYITWIRDFRVREVSGEKVYPEWDEGVGENVMRRCWCHVFEALEGEAPAIV